MLRLFRYLFLGHVHKWKIIKETPYNGHYGNPNKIVVTGVQYTTQCEKCGCIRSFLS